MRRLALVVCLVVSGSMAARAQAGDAEIITEGFKFQEANGIMRIVGEMKNNTGGDFKDLKVRINFKKGRTVIQELTISVGALEARTQGKLDTRTESLTKVWNNYDMAFFEGDKPLFWRLPKK